MTNLNFANGFLSDFANNFALSVSQNEKNAEFYLLYALAIMIGYFSGGLLFAYFIPKAIKHVDITKESDDHNPGTFNAFKYGGFWCGIFALLLELFKGFAPVYAASKFIDANDVLFVPVLLAPVLGHAYSPFFGLKKGGKCIAVSFGVLLGSPAHVLPVLVLAGILIVFSVIIIINPNSLRTAAAYLLWSVSVFFLGKPFSVSFSCVAISAVVISKLITELKAIFAKTAPSEIHFMFCKKSDL